jgi:hypothetical protein
VSQEVEADFVFILLRLEESSTVTEVHIRLRVDEHDAGVTVEDSGVVADQSVCCGSMRQHSLLVKGDVEGTVAVSVTHQTDATLLQVPASYSGNSTIASYVGDENLLQV